MDYFCEKEVVKGFNPKKMDMMPQVICAIITGRCANSYFGDYSINTIIDEAISGADRLIKELKEREETQQ